MRIVQILIVLISISNIFGGVFNASSNVDSKVTFKLGGNSSTVEFVAGVDTMVELSWLNDTSDVELTIVSLDTNYADTVYTTEIKATSLSSEPWDATKTYSTAGTVVSYKGQEWKNKWYLNSGVEPGASADNGWVLASTGDQFKLLITVNRKPFPLDTAYIPIHGNIDFKVTAKAISVISGTVPVGEMVFSFKGKTEDTLKLPVISDGIISINTNRINKSKSAKFSQVKNRISLILPPSFRNGVIKVVSLGGRVVGSMNLSSTTKNSLSVWNVAQGVYILSVKGINGGIYSKKFYHQGSDIKICSSFSSYLSSNNSGIASQNSRTVRAATAQYNLSFTPIDSKYSDSVSQFDFVGQLNDPLSIYLIDSSSTASIFGALMDSANFEEMFPNRYGLGYGNYISTPLPDDSSQIQKLQSDGDYDFYTYNSLIQAIDSFSDIEVDIYQVEGHDYMQRIEWHNKRTDERKEMINNTEYNTYKESGTEVFRTHVDYADFCSKGDIPTKKQELAAFLGNISHETTGGGEAEDSKTWGLYWREETTWQNGGGGIGYTTGNNTYTATSGQSYHGRGPIQISYPYNYGPFSEFVFGDKQVLLDNPGLVVPDKPQEAVLAFMSAIWFWMTPQYPKPSCHDVMAGVWKPSADDISKKRDQSKFGMTVNIINGGLECGIQGDGRVADRIGFYKRYIGLLGESAEEETGCYMMTSY